ncbi:MAG TPA: potassium-transporting ATPase subunit KdpB [Acidiferrobacter sp.]|nr:potassium-transporting ATPase subunit KdpB [Acidiferrobacter sp.]
MNEMTQKSERKAEAYHAQTSGLVRRAVINSFKKFNIRVQISNPVMFIVWLSMFVTLALTFKPALFGKSAMSASYNGFVTAILFFTVWFANFAEALAEGRGKAQAEALRQTKTDVMARRIAADGTLQTVAAGVLRKGDRVRVERGDIIPTDGEILEGIASVDESAITGESAPVLKEPGTDMFSTVTGGTRILSDWLVFKVSADPGHTFLDRMIHLVEGAKRQKTPNEIALTVLLSVLSLIFMVVVVTLKPLAGFLHIDLDIGSLVALLVALMPTTIGALLSAIGIAGIDRATRFNVLAMSGRAVEAAGDVQTLILDKTGTITMGNRQATEFVALPGHSDAEMATIAMLASWYDTTPEGRSIVALALTKGVKHDAGWDQAQGIDFTAETRMSGTNLPDGRKARKGAVAAVARYVRDDFKGTIPAELKEAADLVARRGATPLALAMDGDVIGVIGLSDVLKPGMRERFEHMRGLGIKTIMVTGDNPITARVIAEQAGVDDFVAEAKPEDKIRVIRAEQARGRLVAMTGDGTNDAPALAQADVGLAMHSGTVPAKEAANMIDLDSDPTKLIDVVAIGKQLLITRGALTTFSIANDVAKYFAMVPAMLMVALPGMATLNIMRLATPESAVLSTLIFNAIIIPFLIPLALRGVRFRPASANVMLARNVLIYGVGGLIVPFVGIKVIDLVLSPFLH